MNRCEELKQLIDEGYNLKASAYLALFPNNFGQLVQLPAINEAELIKWNTKIDLFFQKTNSPIRNLKRNEFPNHTIVQYMEIKLKAMEGLLETWKNDEHSKNEVSSTITVEDANLKINSLSWATIGTWTGAVIALLALIWGIYTYFKTNDTPTTNPIIEQSIAPINVTGSNNTVILQQKQENAQTGETKTSSNNTVILQQKQDSRTLQN
jgi:hypothetical protein